MKATAVTNVTMARALRGRRNAVSGLDGHVVQLPANRKVVWGHVLQRLGARLEESVLMKPFEQDQVVGLQVEVRHGGELGELPGDGSSEVVVGQLEAYHGPKMTTDSIAVGTWVGAIVAN